LPDLIAEARLLESSIVDPAAHPPDRFLVCGLGSLGQHCIQMLELFARHEAEVRISAVDMAPPGEWESQDTPSLIDEIFVGDARKESTLMAAGILECRAVLLVTSNETANLAAAFTARRLNPAVRIVVRSSRTNLNELLETHMSNLVALEPTELSAPAFALTALGGSAAGFFQAGGFTFRVSEKVLRDDDDQFSGKEALRLHRRTHRLISALPPTEKPASESAPARSFYQWDADAVLAEGFRIAFVEAAPRSAPSSRSEAPRLLKTVKRALSPSKGSRWQSFRNWLRAGRTRLAVLRGISVAALVWLAGTLILRFNIPGMTWKKAVSSGLVLMLGGFGDVLGGLERDVMPWWVLLCCLGMAMTSLFFVLGVFGLIAERLIETRFDLLGRRAVIPEKGHTVLVGLGRVGQRVARLLDSQMGEPLVALTRNVEDAVKVPGVPVLVGDVITELAHANVSSARCLIAVTDDEVLNLEAALIAEREAKKEGREIVTAVRAYDPEFAASLASLLPRTRGLCVNALSAEAFAAAAYGENIEGLFPLNGRTILVAEFVLTGEDHLSGKLLAEISYGFRVVPVLYVPGGGVLEPIPLPPDDLRVKAGDRLFVLSSLEGLRRIERNEELPRSSWELSAQKPANAARNAEAINALCNVAGYSLKDATLFVGALPGSLRLELFDYQAHRLGKQLTALLPVDLRRVQKAAE
jgi:Trk K+ transport system NAD-binding subunit